MSLEKTYSCSNCGSNYSKWIGRCTSCGEWNSIIEETNDVNIINNVLKKEKRIPEKLENLTKLEQNRISSCFVEFDRVLGGGFVKDEVILLTGDPGVGKSTLLLQTIFNLSSKLSCLYVSGEESVNQIKSRAERILKNLKSNENLYILNEINVLNIINSIEKGKFKFVVIDSIQTVYSEDSSGIPGSINQIKATSGILTEYAKSKGVIMVFVGHINKIGNIAGPKLLEHLVDCVVHFEGEPENDFRILRSLKNRFGSTNEIGIFTMDDKGIKDLIENNHLFIVNDKNIEVGISKSPVLEGSRVFIIDIQALVNKTVFPFPKRVSEGISNSKLQVLSAILEKNKISSTLFNSDIYLKTTGGFKLKDFPYADLAIASSIISSSKNKVFNDLYIFVGEVNLNGGIIGSKKIIKIIKESLRIYKNYKIVAPKILQSDLNEFSKNDLNKIILISHIKELSSLIL